jgi:hypothetical protein
MELHTSKAIGLLELQWSCNGVANVKGNWLAGVAMKLQWSCNRQRQIGLELQWSCNGVANVQGNWLAGFSIKLQ